MATIIQQKRLQNLKRLELVLEQFLAGFVDLETEQMDMLKGVETLDEITKDSLKGRSINNRLGSWFARHNDLLSSNRLKESESTAIGNLLSEIKSGLDNSDPESRKLSDEIEQLRKKGIVPKRKLILKLKSDKLEPNMMTDFLDYLHREASYLDMEHKDSGHLLTILDDVLKSAEAKEDHIYIHLAASIIYFLKMKGYKTGPFVKRLKEIEKNRLGTQNVV